MKKLSVIIVTYQSENDIYDCLASVWQCCDIAPDEVEVIIVDNSPKCEPMFTKLRQRYGDDIVLIHNTHNGGYGQGNNTGIRQAKAPVVLIMNPDVRLSTPFFKTPLEAFDSDPELLMYGAKQMYTPTVKSRSSFSCSYRMNGYARTLIEGICNRLDWYIPRLHYLQGSCFFVRKEPFETIGLFDESVFMYGEEDDIHYRLTQRFGPHFKYDKHLRYLHLTSERAPSAAYEMKLVEVAVAQNEKKGFQQRKTLKNMLGVYTMLSWRERFSVMRGKSPERLKMLQTVRENIREQIRLSRTTQTIERR